LFSAKEAVYKAWFPFTGENLGFFDAPITLTPDGTFSIPLPSPLEGRWLCVNCILVTCAFLPCLVADTRR
jgi:4'-phosphopantetheinyl transferase EntD